MNVIWKYHLSIMDTQYIQMHRDAKILTIQKQNGEFYMWCLFDTDSDKGTRKISICGTGQLFDGDGLEYITSLQEDHFIWHFFDGGWV